MLITTKKGKPGKTAFNLSASSGFNTPVNHLKLMNTQQYLQLRKDPLAADGITPDPSAPVYDPGYAPDLTIFDKNRDIDWQHVIFGKTSNNTDIHATLSGGSYNNTFLLAGGYTRSNFNYPGNFFDQRFTLHSQWHQSSSDGHLVVDFGTDYGYDQNNSAAFGGNSKVLLPPNMPALMDSVGNLQWNCKSVSLSSYQFYAFLKNPTNARTYNLNNTLHLLYKIVTGLSISANMGYGLNSTNEYQGYLASAQNPLYAQAKAISAPGTSLVISDP